MMSESMLATLSTTLGLVSLGTHVFYFLGNWDLAAFL